MQVFMICSGTRLLRLLHGSYLTLRSDSGMTNCFANLLIMVVLLLGIRITPIGPALFL